ncbi:uncharacterized protein KY384_001491 [Bacidia gigantensis]|uniref:uncharacterized protein n=1 Tax=Bacidia gigantensis TaxID=2732470 RepID=UPI001D0587C0|nr:uncharacterized protein KY384_001491 [Bacidia gigantensis]KAG8533750.1 hypothetical protein KY384_001491 [Bacidia gigantensis]
MSLHRVASMTSYEQVRNASPARSEHRKMSFNPAGSRLMPPEAKETPVGAFEVSKLKRILQVVLAVIYCLFSAGVVFGYAAIKPVLVSEGVYRESCDEKEYIITAGALGTCYGQEIRLNLMFTTAAVATNVCALPVGTLLDKYGPRVSAIVGSVLLAIGALLLAFAAQSPFDAYIPGYLFLALGGPFVFISSFQLSNTFPQRSGLILALLTGAFDSSSAIFLIYRLIYEASDQTFTPQQFFLVYLLIPVFILIVQITVMPSNSYKTVGELVKGAEIVDNSKFLDSDGDLRSRQQRFEHRDRIVDETTSLLGKQGSEQEQEEEKKRKISGVWGAQHGRSALQQIKSPWFVLIALFTVVQMTRINYFVATIRTQYEYLLDDNMAETINHFFDVALPVGGICSIPFIGLILDSTSTTFCLGLLVALATVIGILGVLPFLWAAYANVILFVLYRPLYYTAVSDYAAKVFGFQTFGKVYGLVICLAGLLNFSQSALDAATHKGFHRNPIPINVLLIVVALVVGIALVCFVWYKSRHMHREELEEEAEDAPDVVMPGTELETEDEV